MYSTEKGLNAPSLPRKEALMSSCLEIGKTTNMRKETREQLLQEMMHQPL